ncbi:DNA polymerase alpha-associated DNA helicase A [Microdochium nivale]|nr:DNA polymerase alpha-associated DNA helicase A [Microdochium nivale]
MAPPPAGPCPVDIPAFANTQLALLDAELASEVAETGSLVSSASPASLQRAGLAITNLSVASQRTGLGGRAVLELAADGATAAAGSEGELPQHGIRTGDIVLVAELAAGGARKREIADLEKKGARGVVVKVKKDSVAVAINGGGGKGGKDGGDDDDDRTAALAAAGRVWLVKLADEVTHKRMSQTMEKLGKMGEAEYSILIRTLFGLSSPSPVPADLASSSSSPPLGL